jgi:hypothetical protein
MAAPKTGLHYVGLDGKRHELSGAEFPAVGGADRVIAEALCSWSSVQLRNQGIDEQGERQHELDLLNARRSVEVDRVGEEESTEEQVERLAKAIIDLDVGEPSASEGAVDTAIRMLRHAYQVRTTVDELADPTDDEPVDVSKAAGFEGPVQAPGPGHETAVMTELGDLIDADLAKPGLPRERPVRDAEVVDVPILEAGDDGSEVGEEYDSREPLLPPDRGRRAPAARAAADFGDNIPF